MYIELIFEKSFALIDYKQIKNHFKSISLCKYQFSIKKFKKKEKLALNKTQVSIKKRVEKFYNNRVVAGYGRVIGDLSDVTQGVEISLASAADNGKTN